MPLRHLFERSHARRLALALLFIATPLLVLIALEGYQLLGSNPRLSRSRALVARNLEVIAASQNLRSALQDAERGQRGYLLSGAPAYLETYTHGVEQTPLRLKRLQELIADAPLQRQQVQRLSATIDFKLQEMQQTLDAYGQGGLAQAQRIVRNNTGLEAMRSIEGTLDAIDGSAQSLLRVRLEQAARAERETAFATLLDALFAVILLVAAVLLTVRTFRNLRRAETERHAVEERLTQQLLRAQAVAAQSQKMEALGQLTGGVAHDFNNLLHVIGNAATLLERRLQDSTPEVVDYLGMIRRNVERAVSVTARLLAFARRQPLDPKPTDLNRLIAGMSEMLRQSVGERVAIEVVAGAGVWPVAVDRNQFETALLNLAINARDAMADGGKLSIETSNTYLDDGYAQLNPEVTAGQYAMVAVSDSGTGMGAEIMARAFDPFFTTKDADKGTGLGLSQVFGFIKQSGGHIKLYSEEGQGTTVKMYLPRLPITTLEQFEAPVAPAGAGSGETIMFVEDHPDVRTFTAQLLGVLGYRVHAAPDAATALQQLEQLGGVALLFTDVGLPGGMGGRALAEEVTRRWPATKVLFTTGYARNSIVHQGRLDPGVALITKPFSQAALAAKVRAVLEA
ncbi:MAG: CHASE3 domain-containing protein [Gammaproteobacteria bacterium]|nr:CHASE3 domain-containing protein [Gammaproteobacteria bacterium]